MCASAKAAHVGSSLSVIDILAVLYAGVAKVGPDTVGHPERDVVIVSKGHAAAGLYAVLANAGFFPIDMLERYCKDGGPMGGHVTKGHVPGVELSTGSLGHGLPFGIGIAFGRRRKGLGGHIYVVMSDGELDEGSNWEAALVAAHHHLANVTVIVDRNGIQSLGPTEDTVRLEPLIAKWEAFGWDAFDVDGHDHRALEEALRNPGALERPTVILARTLKGKGVSFMESQILWHYRSPSGEALAEALAELEAGD
jgi:transketolase